MLTFKQYLIETSVPKTYYGYWIRTDGKIVPVSFQSHFSVARMLLPGEARPVTAALLSGYIRVVAEPELGSGSYQEVSAEWYKKPTTEAALRALGDVISNTAIRARRNGFTLQIFFDLTDVNGVFTTKQFNNGPGARAFLEQQIRDAHQ